MSSNSVVDDLLRRRLTSAIPGSTRTTRWQHDRNYTIKANVFRTSPLGGPLRFLKQLFDDVNVY
jgi:hypothetical protein